VRESQISPTLRVANRFGFLSFDGTAAERAGLLALRRTMIDAAVYSPPLGLLRGNIAGHFSSGAAEFITNERSSSVTAALSAKLGRGGLWLGSGHTQGLDRDTSVEPIHVTAGGWYSVGRGILTISNARHSSRLGGRSSRVRVIVDTVFVPDSAGGPGHYMPRYRTVGDSGSTSSIRSWSVMELRMDWYADRVALTAAFSGRPSLDTVPAVIWGRIATTVRVTRVASLVASIGTRPTQYWNGLSGARVGSELTQSDILRDSRAHTLRFAALGVRLAPAALAREALPAPVRPAPTAFLIRPIAVDQYRVLMRVSGARTVELAGDFNEWKPVQLTETTAGVWEVTLPLSPGTYRMSVRVDGDVWTAPEGVPSVDDEFNGRVGIVVVR